MAETYTLCFPTVSCIHARHDVRQNREISSLSSSKKDRLDRYGKDEEEGGLTLGSGLEWSGWRGGLGR